MLLVFIGRAAFVFPLSALSNYARRTPGTKINARKQFIIWWAGLIRGAVSIALAFNQFTISGKTMNAENATVISSTIMMVLFSTVVFGIMTKPLIALILPHNLSYASDNSETSSPKVEDLDTDIQNPFLENGEHEDGSVVVYGLLRRSSLSMLLHAPTSTIHKLWRYIDNSYMRPVFGGRGFVPCVPGSPSRGDVDGPLENPFIA